MSSGPVVVQDRVWFNEANESRYFLVPGLIVLVMTVLGALLTALVVAREWEQGTFEALFVTPVRAGEILLSKVIPYLGLGIFGLSAMPAGRQIPLSGSISWIAVGAKPRFTTLPARRAGPRTADLFDGEGSVCRQL